MKMIWTYEKRERQMEQNSYLVVPKRASGQKRAKTKGRPQKRQDDATRQVDCTIWDIESGQRETRMEKVGKGFCRVTNGHTKNKQTLNTTIPTRKKYLPT